MRPHQPPGLTGAEIWGLRVALQFWCAAGTVRVMWRDVQGYCELLCSAGFASVFEVKRWWVRVMQDSDWIAAACKLDDMRSLAFSGRGRSARPGARGGARGVADEGWEGEPVEKGRWCLCWQCRLTASTANSADRHADSAARFEAAAGPQGQAAVSRRGAGRLDGESRSHASSLYPKLLTVGLSLAASSGSKPSGCGAGGA